MLKETEKADAGGLMTDFVNFALLCLKVFAARANVLTIIPHNERYSHHEDHEGFGYFSL